VFEVIYDTVQVHRYFRLVRELCWADATCRKQMIGTFIRKSPFFDIPLLSGIMHMLVSAFPHWLPRVYDKFDVVLEGRQGLVLGSDRGLFCVGIFIHIVLRTLGANSVGFAALVLQEIHK
jgi:hypothetical protein